MNAKHSNFVIAALGSSGTKFLAHTMNRSKVWQVVHMGLCQHVDFDGTTPVETQAILDEHPHHFGDVNGLLLFHLLELRVGRKAVIIRDPRDTLLSWYCDARGKLPPSFFSIYAGGYFALDECLEHGIKCIRFERLVSDPDYLQRILLYFGILDVTITRETLSRKINTKRSDFCATYDAIEEPVRRRFERASGWFARKYYAGDLAHVDDFQNVNDDPDDRPVFTFETRRRSETRSSTLRRGEAPSEPPSPSQEPSPLPVLGRLLGLDTHASADATWYLSNTRMGARYLELTVVDREGASHGILVGPRSEGTPYFLRTRHLHMSHRGSMCAEPLRALMRDIATRLGDMRFEALLALAGETSSEKGDELVRES